MENYIDNLICSECKSIINDTAEIISILNDFPTFFRSFFHSTKDIPSGIGFCKQKGCLIGMLRPTISEENAKAISEEINNILDNPYQIKRLCELPSNHIERHAELSLLSKIILSADKFLILYWFLLNKK